MTRRTTIMQAADGTEDEPLHATTPHDEDHLSLTRPLVHFPRRPPNPTLPLEGDALEEDLT